MITKVLKINFIWILNPFIFKVKDFKIKNTKHIIDFNNIVDDSIDKNNLLNNKMLLSCLLLKKIKKLVNKNTKTNLEIYYVLNKFNDEIVNNLEQNIKKFFSGEINYSIYTDSDLKKINSNKIQYNIFKLENLQ